MYDVKDDDSVDEIDEEKIREKRYVCISLSLILTFCSL